MATIEDAQRLALALPETGEKVSWGNLFWTVKGKGFVWERPLRKGELAEFGDDSPQGDLLGVYTGDLGEKELMLADPETAFFTIEHFAEYPAVLIRLGPLSVERLEEIIEDAWLARAPKKVAAAYLAEHPDD